MSVPHQPTTERLLADLEGEVRPLLTEVHSALGELMGTPGGAAAGRFLAVAPIGSCVRLAEAWAAAREAGLPTDHVRARFDPDDQVLIDIVTSVYASARPGGPVEAAVPELARLLDEATPPPVARN